jgi:hypothetical protein
MDYDENKRKEKKRLTKKLWETEKSINSVFLLSLAKVFHCFVPTTRGEEQRTFLLLDKDSFDTEESLPSQGRASG